MNQAIFYFFYTLAHQSVLLDKVIVFFAEYFPYVILFVAMVFLAMHHEIFRAEAPGVVLMDKRREFLKFFYSGVGAYVVAYILKNIFQTLRPFDALSDVHSLIPESGYAFPSGHAAFLSAIAFTIFFTHKRAGYVFIFLTLLVGIARIASGIHYPVDILGGFLVGFIVAYIVNKFSKKA